jgi:hypothetical protein
MAGSTMFDSNNTTVGLKGSDISCPTINLPFVNWISQLANNLK